MSDSLQPHGLQRTRLPCPPLSPGVCSNSWRLSPWCHPTISSSVAPFSFYLQSFPASGSFPMSRLLTSGDQSIGASASASVLPMNIQGWFPILCLKSTNTNFTFIVVFFFNPLQLSSKPSLRQSVKINTAFHSQRMQSMSQAIYNSRRTSNRSCWGIYLQLGALLM